jgi:hypothetical protein
VGHPVRYIVLAHLHILFVFVFFLFLFLNNLLNSCFVFSPFNRKIEGLIGEIEIVLVLNQAFNLSIEGGKNKATIKKIIQKEKASTM